MLRKVIKYKTFDGQPKEKAFYFNLSKAELTEMSLSVDGGLDKMIEKIVAEQNAPRLVELFKKIILMAYGEKSADGERFVKNQELIDAFSQTDAYSVLFMELATDAEKAVEFFNGIIPNLE